MSKQEINKTSSEAPCGIEAPTKPLPEVTRVGMLDMQVCVPADMTDADAIAFANTANPSGLQNGWQIRRQGNPALSGRDERVNCTLRAGCVHIMFDC